MFYCREVIMVATATSMPTERAREVQVEVQKTLDSVRNAAERVYGKAIAKGSNAFARSIAQEFGLGGRKESAAMSAERSAGVKSGYLEGVNSRKAPVAKQINFDVESLAEKASADRMFLKKLDLYRTLLDADDYRLAKEAASDQKIGVIFEHAAERLDKVSKIVGS